MKKAFTIIIVIFALALLAELLGLTREHIRNLSPEAQRKFAAFLNELKALGYTVVIRDTVRTYAEQKAHHDKDKRNAMPGHSDHETGNAVDMDVYIGSKVLSKKTPKAMWLSARVPSIAKKYGISWGGDFKGYADNNHFYLRA